MSRGDDGFTLVELLVALGLLALLTIYALDALGTLRGMDRAARRIEASDEVEAVARHMAQSIADARTLVRMVDGRPVILFEGGHRRLGLVTAGNDALETGGLYRIGFGLNDAHQLITDRSLYRPDGHLTPAQILLLDKVADISFRYFGPPAPGAQPAWTDEWRAPDLLPRLVETTVEFPQGDPRRWPPLVTRIEAAE